MPKFNPHIANMPIHICQKMGYDWILSDIIPQRLPRNAVLDFGANGYPFLCVLAGYGAEAHWCDRDPRCAKTMAALAKTWNVPLRQYALGDGLRFNIIVASNAIQHNHDGAADIYRKLADALLPDGKLYIVEVLAHGQSWWNGTRADPCWHRTLGDHAVLWREAGLRLLRTGFFVYAGVGAAQSAEWVEPVNGNIEHGTRVCAKLEKA